MKRTALFLSLMLCSAGIMAKDIKTVVVTTTPQMHCNNCELKIKNNLRFEKGVKKIETDIDTSRRESREEQRRELSQHVIHRRALHLQENDRREFQHPPPHPRAHSRGQQPRRPPHHR